MLFELSGVRLRRGGALVLDGVDARLPVGASCVIGPSGAGKSTLLRLLNRLAEPEAGSVRYRERDVRELDPLALRREVGLVPQLPALLDGSVADNLRFAARRTGRAADVSRLLELSGLDPGFGERDARRLSVGEGQRVMLARALALEPRVLLLDEPTAALDPAARSAVERTLLDLRTRLDLSLVLVSHDAAQARRLADWGVWLENRRVVRQGPVAEATVA